MNNDLNLAARGIALTGKPGIDATQKLLVGGFKRTWLPRIKMDGSAKTKVVRFLR